MKKLLLIFTVVVILFAGTVDFVNAQGLSSRQSSFFDNFRSGLSSLFSKASSIANKKDDSTLNSLADLVVYSVAFDPKLGYPIISIRNQGNVKPASSSMVGYEWIKVDGTGIGGVHMLWVGSNIAPGQTLAVNKVGQKYTSSWLPPSSATKVRITIDSQNQIKESKKDNNIKIVDRSKPFFLNTSTQTVSGQGGSGSTSQSEFSSGGGGTSDRGSSGEGSSVSVVENIQNTIIFVISTVTSKFSGAKSDDKDTNLQPSVSTVPSVLPSAVPSSTVTYTLSPTGTVPVPSSTPTSVPVNESPSAPMVSSDLSCSDGPYIITVSWDNLENNPVSRVDISRNISFNSYDNKGVSGKMSEIFTANAGITYYIRLFNGSYGPASSFSLSFCSTPTSTPTPTPPPLPDLKPLSLTFINGKPSMVISNVGDGPANFAGTGASAFVRCGKAAWSSGACASKTLESLRPTLGRGESVTINFTQTLPTDITYYQGYIWPERLTDKDSSNNSLPRENVPTPTPTPTPTSTPTPTRVPVPTRTPTPTPAGRPDFVVDSLTINANTGRAIMVVKNIGYDNMLNIVEVTPFDYTINWKNSAGAVVGSKYGLIVVPMFDSESDPNIVHVQIYDPVPDTAVAFEVTLNDMFFADESNYSNNKLSGSLQRVPTITPSPSPTTMPAQYSASKISDSSSSAETETGNEQDIFKSLIYPIKELGGCQNKEDCKNYCDKAQNVPACVKFGSNVGLMTKDEASTALKIDEIKRGPVGCTSKEGCAAVCDKPENVKACLDYAQENDLMSTEELEKARKVTKVLSAGGNTPGNCSTPDQCKEYCTSDSNASECIKFGEEAGLISAEEAAEANKMKGILENGGPGGCKSRDQCEAYCNDENNREECDSFFEKAGLVDEDKLKERKESEKSKGPKGNGGPVCTTRDECEAFCKNPANAEACKNVVIEKDSSEAGPEIGGDIGALVGNINQMPEESKECLKQALGSENFEKLMKGEMPTTPISGDVMQSCFAKGVEEYEKKMTPTKKPDDFSTEYGPDSSSEYQTTPAPEEIPQDKETDPVGVSEVQGVSTKRSLFDVIFSWFTGAILRK